MQRTRRLLKWILFSVLISLLPLVADFWNRVTHGSKSASVELIIDVLGRGGLLLISGAIAADAIGDLIGSGPEFISLKYASGGACLAVVLLSSLMYAGIETITQPVRGDIVARWSWIIMVFTVVTAGCAKFVAED
jgi:hypothetical protein